MPKNKAKCYIETSPYQDHCYAFHILKEAQDLSRQEPYHRDDVLSEEFGFIVTTAPLTSLPPTHTIWDEFSRKLPAWVNKGTQQQEIAKIDMLSASELNLPREYLCRAITIISHLAHGYYLGDFLNGQKPVTDLPDALEKPWRTLSRRMNRPRIGMTGFESILYNWRLRDSAIPQPRYLENMDLLVQFFGNQEERMFNLSFLEVSLAGSPLLASCIEAQDAVVNKDNERLLEVLKRLIIETAQLTQAILKMDPVAHSENYFDPIIWAKTAPEISKPLRPSEAGLSGGSSPVIQLLDVFLDRSSYKTEMGHQEIERRYWMPRNHQHILDALGAISVKDYISGTSDAALHDAYNQLHETLNGKKGFLNIHRRKIYTYMELGFKAGRNATNAGSQRDSNDEPWLIVDEDLDEGRKERYQYRFNTNQYCTIKKIEPIGEISINVELKLDTGAVYFPGDRCDLYFENTDELIEKTLSAMDADHTSLVRLSREWQEYLAKTQPEFARDIILLRNFLRFAKIRPLDRDIATIFYHLTQDDIIREILDEHLEDQFELWDFLELIKPNYDTKQLWEISPWQKENISRILPPNQPRVYSIASASQRNQHYYSDRISLIITKFSYNTTFKNKTTHRVGTATKFLTQPDAIGKRLKIEFESPSFFNFMKGIQHPTFLFAGGSSISSFISLFEYIDQIERSCPPKLFYSCRDYDNFLHKEYLLELASKKKLELFIVFSRMNENELKTHQRQLLQRVNATVKFNSHVDDLILDENVANLLYKHLCLPIEDRESAFLYISCKTFFFKTVLDSIEKIIDKKHSNERDYAKKLIEKLYAEKRIQSEVFTEYIDAKTNKNAEVVYIPISSVIEHNCQENGYWIIINDIVYDITDFISQHPGGNKILIANCGMDGTRSYQNVEHHLWPEIESLLNAYQIGIIKPVQLSKHNETCVVGDKLTPVSEQFLYDFMIDITYKVVEMENTLNNSYTIPLDKPEMNCAIAYDVHKLISNEFLPKFANDYLIKLWNISASLYNQKMVIADIQKRVTHLTHQIHVAPESFHIMKKSKPAITLMEQIITTDQLFFKTLKAQLKVNLIVLEQDKERTLIFEHIESIQNHFRQYIKQMRKIYQSS